MRSTSENRSRRWWRIPARVALVYLMLLTFVPAATPAAFAQDPATADEADDGALEMGAEWVGDYENCGGWGLGDLGGTSGDANGLRNSLTAFYWFPPFFSYPTPQWQSNFVYGNGMAWERDWKRSALGGTEEFYIDNVDLAYFTGHGSSGGFFFGVGGNKLSDCILTANDSAFAWGTRDNDWIGLSACNVLDDPFVSFSQWANSMNGTRLLMGFQTVMGDVPFGNTLGWNIRWGNTMTQSWFRSANALLPSSQVARILAEDNAYFNDRWYNHASPTVVDSTFWWWTHRAGTNIVTAAAADSANTLAQLGGEMPVFQVAPLSLEEAEGQYAQVANAFGLTETEPITSVSVADIFGTEGSNAAAPMFVSSDGSLLMDPSAGIYEYIDQDNLWNGEQAVANQIAAASGDAIRAISQDEAREIADAFLDNSGLGEEDGEYSATVSDVLSQGAEGDDVTAAAIVQEFATNYIVDYSRTLNYQPTLPGTTQAAGDPVQFTVAGPGPKLSVYVNATAPAGATAAELAQDSVLGGQGGWRQIQQATAADGSALTVTMLPTSTIATLFEQVEERVALDYVPLAAASREILQFTPTYYEGPMGMNMDQLIPIYQLLIKATTPAEATAAGADVTQEYEVFIPVNASYMAPYAEILTPVASTVNTGDDITLTAADASQTLAELGYDDSLNFALGTGDPDSYTYDWYLNVISDTLTAEGGKIGTGMTFNYEIPAGSSDDGKPSQLKFILVVTDTLKNGDPKVAQDEMIVTVNPVYLPTIGGQPANPNAQ